MSDNQSGLAYALLSWGLNISSSVGIIFTNKFLMSAQYLGFGFSSTISGMHFLCAASVTLVVAKLGWVEYSGKKLPNRDLFWYVFYSSLALICLNLSLVINNMGFYQLMKLTVIPYVALVEVLWRGKRYTMGQTGCMMLVVAGVGVVTVSGVEVRSALGIGAAVLATIGGGMQQIYCVMLQKEHGMSSMDLLQATMWTLGSFTFAIGPLADYHFYHQWVLDFQFTPPVLVLLAISCSFAVLVNLS